MSIKNIVTQIVVGAVIIDQEKVLLLQRNANESVYPNLWELPSGKKEPLEKSIDALVREVREETGLIIISAEPFFVFDYQIEKLLETRDSIQINYLATVNDYHTVNISEEHQNFTWVNMEEISKYNVTDLTKETIKKAFERFSNTIKKMHS